MLMAKMWFQKKVQQDHFVQGVFNKKANEEEGEKERNAHSLPFALSDFKILNMVHESAPRTNWVRGGWLSVKSKRFRHWAKKRGGAQNKKERRWRLLTSLAKVTKQKKKSTTTARQRFCECAGIGAICYAYRFQGWLGRTVQKQSCLHRKDTF